MDEKLDAGRRVAARLLSAENAIDDALLANAALQIAMVTARRDIQAPCGLNHAVLADLLASNNALIEARGKMVRAHLKIAKLRTELGMDEANFGCERPCLNSDQPAPIAHLQLAS